MGIVFVQNITMLNIWENILHGLENILGTTNYIITFTVTFFIAMAIPVALLILTGLIAKKFNKATIMENFARFGYSLIPLDLAGHIAHNLFHLLAEGKSVVYTIMEFFGVSSHGASTAIFPSPTIQMFQYIIIVIGTIGSIYTAYRIAKSSQAKTTILGTSVTYTILMVLLAAANIFLFSIPMAMRM